MAWKEPKTDWNTNPKSPMAEDFNRIEGNIIHVLNEIEAKKGGIVDAINTKRVTASLENSYQELADIIRSINLNNRVTSGAGTLVQISNTRATLTVTGLSFKPSKVFVRGSVRCKYRDNNLGGTITPNSLIYDYGIVDGIIRPSDKSNVYTATSGGFAYNHLSTVKVTCTVIYEANGFVVELRQTEPSGYLNMDNYSTQYWFAQE